MMNIPQDGYGMVMANDVCMLGWQETDYACVRMVQYGIDVQVYQEVAMIGATYIFLAVGDGDNNKMCTDGDGVLSHDMLRDR